MDYSSHSREPDTRHNHLIHPLSVCCSSQLAMCIQPGQWEPSKARNVRGHPLLLVPCTRSLSHLHLVLDRWSQKPTPWDQPGRTRQLLVLRPSMCLLNTMVCHLCLYHTIMLLCRQTGMSLFAPVKWVHVTLHLAANPTLRLCIFKKKSCCHSAVLIRPWKPNLLLTYIRPWVSESLLNR